MTKILNYFHLCPINDEEEFLGLSHDEIKGSIINTLGKNIILNIKLNNQKQINSWTCLEKLSSKVIYDSNLKQYVGVFARKWIRCWDKTCSDINAVKKIKLSKPIHELISTTNNGTIVLYVDGTCESIEYAIETRKEKKDLLQAPFKPVIDALAFDILQSMYFSSANRSILLTYFVKSRINNETFLIYSKLDSETMRLDGITRKVKLMRDEKNIKLCAFTVVNSTIDPQLVTIWSDRRIFMMPIRLNETNMCTPGYFVSVLNSLKIDQPISILGISRDSIAIYGANETPQEGAALILYNTQFKVIESKQLFKVYFNKSRLWVVDTYVFLAVGQKLAVVSFRVSNEQLADMLGSQRTSHLTSIVDTECINPDAELEEMTEFNKMVQNSVSDTINVNKMDYDDDDDKIMEFNFNNDRMEDVNKIINDIRANQHHNITAEFIQDSELLADMINLKLLPTKNSTTFENKTIQMIATELERMGECEIAINNFIIPMCIEYDSPKNLLNCIQMYRSISESMIALSIKYFITKIRNEKKCENASEFMKTILTCKFEAQEMRDQLRTYLKFDDVLFLLNYIFEALEAHDATEAQYRLNDDDDEDYHLINWFSILIDSHYHQFLLSRNSNLIEKLEKWKNLIDNLLVDLHQSKSLTAMIYDLVNGKSIAKENIASKWYSVEEVQLY